MSLSSAGSNGKRAILVLSAAGRSLCWVVLLACTMLAQATPPAQKANVGAQKPDVPDQHPEQKPASPGSGSAQAQEKPAGAPSTPPEESKITPQQAKELFHTVDEILVFDSKKTGLPIKRQVKRK